MDFPSFKSYAHGIDINLLDINWMRILGIFGCVFCDPLLSLLAFIFSTMVGLYTQVGANEIKVHSSAFFLLLFLMGGGKLYVVWKMLGSFEYLEATWFTALLFPVTLFLTWTQEGNVIGFIVIPFFIVLFCLVDVPLFIYFLIKCLQ
eukprot:TRINITY_DN1617_c0_g1_i1.p1 TRINITY_DN1617_c0_g1~~TRINITY_DN1617_c0_g1_i1.p1  ORF type:complete len:147 (+),score=24.13 TRINITY_DN1617_c0_g1_i1:225-665(+)